MGRKPYAGQWTLCGHEAILKWQHFLMNRKGKMRLAQNQNSPDVLFCSLVLISRMLHTKQRAYRVFTRKYGVLLQPEATQFIVDFVDRHQLTEDQVTDLLEQLASYYVRTEGELPV
jgi:hypothetical protein